MDTFRRVHLVLREPLLHFLLLGLGLFLLHSWVAPPGSDGGERIVITRGRIAQLSASFALMNQRAPSPEELNGLIDDAIREEVLYREAKTLGLDQDDTIVRRRLRQKLEFVSEDLAPVPEPTDAQLQAYLLAHPDKFRLEARYTFMQVYFDPKRHSQQLDADLKRTLSALQDGGVNADVTDAGDALLLEHHFDAITSSELKRLFGANFEVALQGLPTGRWIGPVPSGYGVHLVFVSRRDDGTGAALDRVRDDVRREWLYDKREDANERYYTDLRKRFEVTVERSPEPRIGTGALAVGMSQ